MTRALFGGALSCAIPEGFADVSSFRQVPDNQEVFANAQTDQCVIVELLQYESDVCDDESARFFFNEIAASNGCSPDDVSILHSELLAANDGPAIAAAHTNSILVGDQRVAKFKEDESAKNVVRVYLGNIRLPSVTTDVVISVSVPLQISAASSSAGSFQLENSAEIGAALFMQVVKSFTVHDWSLFG
uniref:Ran guanine nucleotide release factor n=1 Tax=Globisporangium ultimum (strain ATCC 200006 / CBS 805.95 / DAOM BR144) TaxID=431595 RepID=K3WBQ5_GLOUD